MDFKLLIFHFPFYIFHSLVAGGDKGSRTPDLLRARQALYQLSYVPTGGTTRI